MFSRACAIKQHSSGQIVGPMISRFLASGSNSSRQDFNTSAQLPRRSTDHPDLETRLQGGHTEQFAWRRDDEGVFINRRTRNLSGASYGGQVRATSPSYPHQPGDPFGGTDGPALACFAARTGLPPCCSHPAGTSGARGRTRRAPIARCASSAPRSPAARTARTAAATDRA